MIDRTSARTAFPGPAEVSDVLQRAAALVDERRFREAIDYATAENRRLRNATIEHRLVRWRHRAFETLAPRARPDWPPAIPDRFAGTRGVPEIAAEALSADTLGGGILHHGCLLVRGLIPREEATRLADGISQVFETRRVTPPHAPPIQGLPWFAPFQAAEARVKMQRAAAQKAGAAAWTADSPRMLFDLIDVFERRGVVRVIEGYLGERPILSMQKATLRIVPCTSGTDWHQDGAFLGGAVRAVNVWLALSDCGVHSPGLDLVPRRFDAVIETGTQGAKFGWSIGSEAALAASVDTPVVSPVFAAGDAVMFDHLCLHRTGVRPGMTRSRWAAESWFFAPSAKPEGHHAIVL